MYILVDTNVYLDLIMNRGSYSSTAKDFFKNAIKTRSKIFMSSMSLRDIGYVVAREYHSQEKGRLAQLKAYELCHKVIDLSNDDAIEALYSDMKDYEDAVLIESAKREMVDLFITNNIKDFKDANFPVWTPEQYNQVINRQV